MSSLDYLDLCRLCLVKDRVSVPIFEGEGDVRQIFLKIAACLPVKVGREDKLPKKICDDCVYKVELFYQFWNTTANAEKQLLQWLGEVSLDEKQGYVTGAHNTSMMKPGQNSGENRLDGSVMQQQVNDQTSGMGMGMMDGMGMTMPIMIPNSGQQSQSQQPMTSVPMDTGGNAVQTVQAVPGPSAQIAQQKINPPTSQEEDEDESEEEDNSDDECDGDDGLPVKEESEDEPGNRTIEPTTFVNVSLACDEAGPSGLQQQKIGEMPEMVMPSTDGDPKSGYITADPLGPDYLTVKIMDDIYRIPKSKCYMMLTRPEIEDESTLEKTSGKARDGVSNVEESFADETARVSSSAEDIATVKIECPEHEDIGKREPDEKRDGKPRKRRKSRSIEETRLDATVQSSRRDDTEDSDSSPLVNRNIEIRDDTEDDPRDVPNDDNDDKTRKVGLSESPNNREVPRIGDSPRGPEKRKKEPPYGCEPCGYKFSRKWKYERHMNTHNKIKPDPVNYECTLCEQSYKRKSAYNRHMLKHSTERPHKCDDCGKTFKQSWEVKRHMKIHAGSMYTCELCSFKTAYQGSLTMHKKGVHQKDYPHKCEKCDKAYLSKHELNDHATSHLGTKSFVCEICGSAYTQKSHLLYHKRVIHGVQNRAPKNLKCDMCDKTFATEYCLRSHVSLHSQKFLCSECGKEFANNHSLKLHSRMHTGERPYSCNVCSKAFAGSNALSVHKLTHTGARPYRCDLCDKSFTQRTTMMIHRRKHPGDHPPPPPISLSKYDNAHDASS